MLLFPGIGLTSDPTARPGPPDPTKPTELGCGTKPNRVDLIRLLGILPP